MLHNKYILGGALCLSAFVQGASSKLALIEGGKLNLSDCFIRDTVRVPGPEHAYEEVITGINFPISLSGKVFPVFSFRTSFKTNNLMKICAGFMVGLNADFTKKSAQEVRDILRVHEHHYLDRPTKEIKTASIRQASLGDISRLALKTEMRLGLFRFQCTDDKPVLKYLGANDSKYPSYETPIDFIEARHSILLPPNQSHLVASIREEEGLEVRLAQIKKHAAELCSQSEESHLAPILIVSRAKLEEYARQQFSEQAH